MRPTTQTFEYNGEVYSASKLVDLLECNPETDRNRIKRVRAGKMTPEAALKPINKNRQRAAINRIEGAEMSRKRIARAEELKRQSNSIAARHDAQIDKWYAPLPGEL